MVSSDMITAGQPEPGSRVEFTIIDLERSFHESVSPNAGLIQFSLIHFIGCQNLFENVA